MKSRTPNTQPLGRGREFSREGWDIVEILRTDPGRFTLGELLQQREAALHEIIRLRETLIRPPYNKDAASGELQRTGNIQGLPSIPAIRPGMLVSAKDLKQFLGIGISSLYKMVAEGRFPKQTHFGPRTARWRSDDVIAWLDQLR
jgi:prophage regulatory protein